jgi:hypothetical protein
MRTLCEVTGSLATQGLLVAIQGLLDVVDHEPVTRDARQLASDFNVLLQQAKDQFRDADTLRLIEPLGMEASPALVAVRLALVRRTIAQQV